jgi:Ca2+-binding RTX toxin-like protein
MIESLENRFLMAAVAGQGSTKLVNISLSSGTLNITGSSQNDSIYIRHVGSELWVTAYNSIMTWSSYSTRPIYSSQTVKYPLGSATRLNANLYAGNDTLHQEMGPAQATVNGGEGNDRIRGRFGMFRNVARLNGNAGSDTFELQGQFAYADGGAGSDTFRWYNSGGHGPMVDYSLRTANITADMDGVADDGEAGEGDNIEPSCFGIIGGSGNDYLAGSFTVAGTSTAGEGQFYGNAGNDTIFGGVGHDRIMGGDGDDQLHGGPVGDGPGIGDFIMGENGNDTLWGTGASNDSLDGGVGEDVIHPTE